MTKVDFHIKGGIYLVLDPAMESSMLLAKLELALRGGIQIVQIWNHWQPGTNKLELIESIGVLCQRYEVPLIIDDDWALLLQTPHLQGVHFDGIPADINVIRKTIKRTFIAGITCSNSLENAIWANEQQFDYISFCSMFPSPSAGMCDIVMPATVKQAKAIINLPVFVSGGITPENLIALRKEISFDGVAVISGIMSDNDPEQKVKQYKDALSINPDNYATENYK